MADKIKLREIFKKPIETPVLSNERKWYIVGIFTALIFAIVLFIPFSFILSFLNEFFPNPGLIRAVVAVGFLVPFTLILLAKAKPILTFCLNMGLLMEKSNSKKEALKNGVNIEKE